MTQFVVWLNALANGVGRAALAPVAVLPGWLSATLIAAATGIVALVAFKYTSNQRAILRVRRDIQADLLCLSLFKEDVLVSLRAQGRVVISALKLLLLAIVPMAVLTVPMALLLGQLALWYQVRPLAIGEEAVLTLNLAGASGSTWPDVRLESIGGAEATRGPVRIRSQRRICWTVRAQESGSHRVTFDVAGQKADKELAVGPGFQRTSPVRPGWNWSDALLYPAEDPFRPESAVQSIEIDYPTRPGWISGSNSWLVYWFLMSMLVAFAFRRVLNVNV